MRAIDRADVALLVVDSEVGVTDQDQRVAAFAEAALGRTGAATVQTGAKTGVGVEEAFRAFTRAILESSDRIGRGA